MKTDKQGRRYSEWYRNLGRCGFVFKSIDGLEWYCGLPLGHKGKHQNIYVFVEMRA
jgi:hypothetical protein